MTTHSLMENKESIKIKMKDRIREDIDKINEDLDRFCDLYDSKDCWQGEAADESACFISADIDSARKVLADIADIANESEA